MKFLATISLPFSYHQVPPFMPSCHFGSKPTTSLMYSPIPTFCTFFSSLFNHMFFNKWICNIWPLFFIFDFSIFLPKWLGMMRPWQQPLLFFPLYDNFYTFGMENKKTNNKLLCCLKTNSQHGMWLYIDCKHIVDIGFNCYVDIYFDSNNQRLSTYYLDHKLAIQVLGWNCMPYWFFISPKVFKTLISRIFDSAVPKIVRSSVSRVFDLVAPKIFRSLNLEGLQFGHTYGL